MSFDLYLQRFQEREPAPADRDAVMRVLRRYSRADGDKQGVYPVDFADGSSVEFSAKGLQSDEEFSGCAFHLRSSSAPVITFVYQVAVAGDFVVINAQGNGSLASPLSITVEWNIPFLPWLKALSIAADEKVAIDYAHERGDYLYGVAWWSSDPASAEGQVEVFGIQSYDGMVNPEWRRQAIRHADGRIEFKVNEWASGCLPDD